MKVKSREECFLGLHFDFHAMNGDSVGEIIDIDSIEKMLDATMPDMIQVDTKGHPGISSYMTKAGVHAQMMYMDVLKVWRELTAKRGIRLYAHHSGLFDQMQAKLHPEWAVVDPEGVVSENYISMFSPYVDEVLIPQLLEIAGEYQVDGAWVDGECWGAYLDYSENARNAWTKEKGTEVPYPGDDEFEDYREFCREGFRRYVTHYIQAVKAQYPDFEITSNWMYSHYMPEKRSVPIDFISGDYDCNNSVRSGRELGRCIVNQNITWDLMAWGQNARPLSWITRDRCTKEAVQLCQEAAAVLSLGGGFQFFNILYGTGGLVQEWAIPGWQEVAQFCRERQEHCFRAESIADIGIIYPKYYGPNKLFMGGAIKSVRSWISMVADAGLSCNVINEADMGDLSQYKVIAMPAAAEYVPETMEKMEAYARNGGTVIADGGVKFAEALSGVRFAQPEKKLVFVDGGDRLSCLDTDYYEPQLVTAQELLYCYEKNYYYEGEKHLSCALNQVGKGQIASLCFDLGNVYSDNITYALRRYVKALFAACGYEPFISVEGSSYADVTLMKKDGRTMVNIINMAGEHNTRGVRTFNEIPKIGPLKVIIRSDKQPKKAVWQPEGRNLEISCCEEGFECRIDVLEIHGIVEIEW